MMVGGMPMGGGWCGVEPVVGTLACANDEDDQRDRPRRWWCRSLGLGLVARKFGHRFPGAVIIDQRFAGGGCGDESSGGGIVERPRQAQAGLVEPGNGVVCEQRIGSTDQRQVMTQVVRRFTKIHRGDLVARRNPLIQGSIMAISP